MCRTHPRVVVVLFRKVYFGHHLEGEAALFRFGGNSISEVTIFAIIVGMYCGKVTHLHIHYVYTHDFKY